jgi:hypothetical protein
MKRTEAEKVQFEREWDKRVEEGWKRSGKPVPEPSQPGKIYPPSIVGSRSKS